MEGPLALHQPEERDSLLHRFGALLESDPRLEAEILDGSNQRATVISPPLLPRPIRFLR